MKKTAPKKVSNDPGTGKKRKKKSPETAKKTTEARKTLAAAKTTKKSVSAPRKKVTSAKKSVKKKPAKTKKTTIKDLKKPPLKPERKKKEGKKAKAIKTTLKEKAKKTAQKIEPQTKQKQTKTPKKEKQTVQKVSTLTKTPKDTKEKIGRKERKPTKASALQKEKPQKTVRKVSRKTEKEKPAKAIKKKGTKSKGKEPAKPVKKKTIAKKPDVEGKKSISQRTIKEPAIPKKKPPKKIEKVAPSLKGSPPKPVKKAAQGIQKKGTKSTKRAVVTKKEDQVWDQIDTKTDKERAVYRTRWKDQPSLIKEHQAEPGEGLPAAYEENNITLMVVDPHTIFAYWEVREDALQLFEGALSIRLYDVTGVDFDPAHALSYTDFEIENRIGSAYLNVADSGEYIAEIGIIYKNVLITIERSNRVHTPIAIEEKVFDKETPGSDQVFGYEKLA